MERFLRREFVVVPEKTVVPLGEELSFEQGALIEPLAVGMHAVRQHQVGLEDTVLNIGAEPSGWVYCCVRKPAIRSA